MSAKFATVKKYYDLGVWTKEQVKNGVAKGWLTPEEFKVVTGEDYTN